MLISSIFYYSLGTAGLAGYLILFWEWHRMELMLIKRWRMAGKGFNPAELPVLRPLLEAVKKRKRSRVDQEIFEAISYLRNITIIGEGENINVDSILEQLVQRKGYLSDVYAKTLHLFRQNRKTEAVEFFSYTTGTKAGRDFIRMLFQWDYIKPNQLLETLLSHQKSLREEGLTLQKRRDEIVSDLIYLPVVVNIMMVFINFIYIAYYIDQKEMLTMLI